MGVGRPSPHRQLTEHDRVRLRTTARVVLSGPVAGVLGAFVIAAIGGSGRAGLATLLLFCAAGAIVGALVTLLQALVDEYRGRPVALRRAGWGVGLLFVTVVLLVLLGGVAGEAA